MKKASVIILSAILLFSFLTIIAAEDNSTNPATGINNSTNQTHDWSKVCSAINNRVEGRIKMFEEGRDHHMTRFSNIVNNLNKIAEKADLKGYNTTQLDNDLIALNESIAKFHTDYAEFIQKLNNTKEFTCGHSEGQFKESLNISKEQLIVVRADIENIKKFIQITINQDIRELRLQKAKQNIEDAQKRIKERMARLNQTIEKERQRLNDKEQQIKQRAEKIKNRMNNLTR
ncbi:Uncharacterised protein [uncultured archaeon]|nr:Uncharacterised protein [uncultured archaeon]